MSFASQLVPRFAPLRTDTPDFEQKRLVLEERTGRIFNDRELLSINRYLVEGAPNRDVLAPRLAKMAERRLLVQGSGSPIARAYLL